MKLSKIAGVVAVAAANFISAPLWASNFSIPRPFVLYYVDGAKTSFSFIKDSSKFELGAGSHQVVVRFEGAYRDSHETRIVTSEPVVINFNIEDPSVDYSLNFKYPRNFDKAEAYASNPVVTLVTSDGNAVTDAEIFVLPHKPGLQIGRDYLREIADLGKAYQSGNPEDSKVLVANANGATLDTQKTIEIDTSAAQNTASAATATVAAAPQTVKQTVQSKAAPAALENLKKAFRAADPETQKLFKIWIVTGEE